MPIYKTSGTLTDSIKSQDGVQLAQDYLTHDDMTQFLDPLPNDGVVEHIEWSLDGDGFRWTVTAYAPAPLSDAALEALSSWVSGQNSDGLGEGFEQQDFAWVDDDECEDCDRVYGSSCGGCGHMCSFDWEKNPCKFERVK